MRERAVPGIQPGLGMHCFQKNATFSGCFYHVKNDLKKIFGIAKTKIMTPRCDARSDLCVLFRSL